MQLFQKGSLQIFVTDILVWVLAMLVFVLLRFSPNYAGPDVIRPTAMDMDYFLYIGMQAGIILGVVYGLVDIILNRNWLRRRSYGSILLIKGAIHFAMILVMSVLIRIEAFDKMDIEISRENLRDSIINPGLLLVLGYTTMVSFFLNFSRQINLKFGPGNLWKFLTGRFHHPKEEERIFMFLDMLRSTTIAEQLGHVKFGELVQDCFSDLSVVRNREAQVYQYVGDEAILYWEVDHGLRNANCLLAFFEFNELLNARKSYYEKTYGVNPVFKAGVNIGVVTVTEVGDIKRDLAFLGDTMNTAARIEGECNKHQVNLLISGSLNSRLGKNASFKMTMVDRLALRGKQQEVEVYKVDKLS